MTNTPDSQLESLKKIYQRRLKILEQQEAQYGDIAVPPHIKIEIEDLQHKIENIDSQLNPVLLSNRTLASINILFLAADPTDAARLRMGEELREIQSELQLSGQREKIVLNPRFAVRPADVSRALLELKPNIVHFSGHGTYSGELCFEDSFGTAFPIPPNALSKLFEQFANQVNCIVLNACYSQQQANALAQHISFVIGMSTAIGDQAAIKFSVGFYQALGAGCQIEQAYQLGCAQIHLNNIPEHLTPVLVRRQ